MDSAVKHWVGLWDYLDGNFWHVWHWAAGHLRPEEVAWQPASQVLAGHLVTMRSGSRDDGRFRDLQTIAAYHRQVRPAYRTFLSSLTGPDLDRVLDRTARPSITLAWAVGHIA